MGGPGSGRWYRWQGTRATLDEAYRLDVRWLQRHGYLDGRPHWVTWSRGEQQAGSLLLALQPEGVVLTYRCRVGGGDWESVRQVVTKSAERPRRSRRGWIGVGRAGLNAQEPNNTHAVPEPSMGEGTAWVEALAFMPGRTSTLAWTPCYYGGARPWFWCVGCRRRVAVLCGGGKWFLCRHCYALPYGSQQETAEERHSRKVRKIRDRLGASHNLLESIWPWHKPKGMHWRTWERLRVQEEQAHRVVLADLEGALVRLRRGL